MNKSDTYKEEHAPKYYKLIAKYYADTEGPYLLGDKITYVDFAVYQSIDNDRRTGTLVVSGFVLFGSGWLMLDLGRASAGSGEVAGGYGEEGECGGVY